jgi:hypothetical protein
MQPVIPRSEEAREGKAVVFAEHQPQYHPLPARVTADGGVHTEWELTHAERKAVAAGARVQLTILTFGGELQPVRLMVEGVEPDPRAGSQGDVWTPPR